MVNQFETISNAKALAQALRHRPTISFDPPPIESGASPTWHAGGGGSREIIEGFHDGSSIDQAATEILRQQWEIDHSPLRKALPFIAGGGLILLLIMMSSK